MDDDHSAGPAQVTGDAAPGPIDVGRLASATPLSDEFGFDRGQPIDRLFIETFLDAHRADIRGRALEIGDDSYCRRFGDGRIDRQDVLNVHAVPGATIVGDLSRPGLLPAASFDAIVFTQTLHIIYDMRAAVRALHAALKPGGVALVTVPGITRIDPGEWSRRWFWSLTPLAAWHLFAEFFDPEDLSVDSFGNVYSATLFLHGAAVAEADPALLAPHDPTFPVIVTIRARRRTSRRGLKSIGRRLKHMLRS